MWLPKSTASCFFHFGCDSLQRPSCTIDDYVTQSVGATPPPPSWGRGLSATETVAVVAQGALL